MPKCSPVLTQQIRQPGFDVDFEAGKFQVPRDRLEALKGSIEGILSFRYGRVQARSLASVTRTVLSMHLSCDPVVQLYSRHLHALINSALSHNCWVVLMEGAVNELLFWKDLPHLEIEISI